MRKTRLHLIFQNIKKGGRFPKPFTGSSAFPIFMPILVIPVNNLFSLKIINCLKQKLSTLKTKTTF